MFWILWQIVSVSLSVFSDFLLFFQLREVPLAFHFTWLWFCELGETVTYRGLEEVFLCGMAPYRLRAQCLCGRAVLDVNTSYVFPQGVLAAVTLVGGGLEVERLELHRVWGGASFLHTSHHHPVKLLEQNPWRSGLSWLYAPSPPPPPACFHGVCF